MPVTATTVAVRGGRWNVPVYRSGRGQALLWLHGAGGMARGLPPEIETLSTQYEVIAPVLPGWQDTPGLEHIDDVREMALFLQELAEALGIAGGSGGFFAGGHSLGGMFAAELAAARPDLVRKLVLVCPVGLWLDDEPIADFFTVLPPDLPALLFGDPDSPAVKAAFAVPTDEEELAQAMYLQIANMNAAAKFMWPIPDKGLKRRIHRISAPTLILWGDRDRLAPPAYGPLWASKIRQAQLVTVPGAGHMLPVEDGAAFVREVAAFLG